MNDSYLTGGGEDFYRQVVKYKVNADGEITWLYSAGTENPQSEPSLLDRAGDELVRYADANRYYKKNGILSADNLGRNVALTDETVIFEGPLDDSGFDYDDYSVYTGIKNIKDGYVYGTVNVYDMLYNDVPGAIFYRRENRAESIDPSAAMSIITAVRRGLDKSGDEAIFLTLLTNGAEEKIAVSDKCLYNRGYNKFSSPFGADYSDTDFATLKKGDMLQITKKDDGIISLRILAKAKDLVNDTEIQAAGGMDATVVPTLETVFGTAWCYSDGIFKIDVNGKYYSYKDNGATVYIVDKTTDTVRKGKLSDIVYQRNSANGSKVFVHANSKAVKDIVIIK